MRFITRMSRAAGAAAAIVAAAVLAVAAGRVGTTSILRVAALLALCVAAVGLVALAAPAVGFPSSEELVAVGWPALILVVVTATLTGVVQEVRNGQWVDGFVQEAECAPGDSGCTWTYRVSDAVTEHDFGWIACDDAGLHPGGHTRVHVDPAGRRNPTLQACAFTSPRWTTAWRVALAVYGVVAVAVFAGSLVVTRRERRPPTVWS
jgi:hypothetical protein